MSRQFPDLARRAAHLHEAHVARQVRIPPTTTTSTTPTITATTRVRPTKTTTTRSTVTTTTSTSTNSTLVGISTTANTTTPLTASTTSTTSIPLLTTSTTSTPLVTSLTDTGHRVLPSSTPSAPTETSTSKAETGGLGTGSVLGIVGGTIVGFIGLCVFVAFVVRHARKKRTRGAVDFNVKEFRKSAVPIDDAKAQLLPRPPSMIERRQQFASQNGPSHPGAAFPYSDAASMRASSIYSERTQRGYPGHGPGGPPQAFGQVPPPAGHGYGGPQPFNPYGHDQGHGAPPIPGTYGPGAYAPYGPAAQSRFGPYGGYNQQPQQQQQQQQQQYPQQNGQPYNQYIHGFQNPGGQRYDEPNLPNPFGRSPDSSPPSAGSASANGSFERQPSLNITPAAAPSSTGSSGSASSSSAMRTANPDTSREEDDAAPPAYEDDGSHERLKKNEKATYVSKNAAAPASSPGAGSSSAGSSSAPAAGPGASPARRQTTQAEDDVYGGI